MTGNEIHKHESGVLAEESTGQTTVNHMHSRHAMVIKLKLRGDREEVSGRFQLRKPQLRLRFGSHNDGVFGCIRKRSVEKLRRRLSHITHVSCLSRSITASGSYASASAWRENVRGGEGIDHFHNLQLLFTPRTLKFKTGN